MRVRRYRALAIGAVAAAVMALAGPASAGGSSTPRLRPSHSASAHQGRAHSAVVALYDQSDNPASSSQSINSQNYEAAFDNFDAIVADDFAVPAGQAWTIDSVEAIGSYAGGPAATYNVFLYGDRGAGVPAQLVASYPGVTPSSDVAGDVTLPLAGSLSLTRGNYWVGVQANLDFGSSGEWFWSARTVQTGDEAAYENPGNGFGTGCTTFAPKISCSSGSAGAPDQLFRLFGTSTACTISGQGYIAGTSGDDVICGSVNHDRISGGPGNDTIFGGTGKDILNGRVGNDTLDGGPGLDVARGAAGDDHINLRDNAGGDRGTGGPGLDTLQGDAGDTLNP
jgi:Ca2+-binding RTX toxin-like protein